MAESALMRKPNLVVLAGLVMAVYASSAFAQSERRVGFVLAYPGSVGVEWQAAPRVAVRFDAGYQRYEFESTTRVGLSIFPVGSAPAYGFDEFTSRHVSRSVAVGVSVLIDLHRSDELRLYIAPRAGAIFDHSTDETEFDGDPARLAAITFPANEEDSSTGAQGGVSLGASRDLSERFRVFGEAGLTYSRQNFGFGAGDDAKSRGIGLGAGVGVVILF